MQRTKMLLTIPVFFVLGLQLVAQDDARKLPDGKQQPVQVTITGCLVESEDAGLPKQFVLKSVENATYPLDPGNQDLGIHVGEMVTISGTTMKGIGAHNEDRIRVDTITVLSPTCKNKA
jgi:hypothetical protein